MKEYDIKQRTFNFALETLKTCKKIVEKHREFVLTKQLTRSSTSIGANMREARNAISKNEFIYKLTIAQKECDETMYWLELLKNFISDESENLDPLLNEANELMKIISSIIIKVKTNSKWVKK